MADPLQMGSHQVRDDQAEGMLDGALVCRQVHQITHDVQSFVLQTPAPRSHDFQPGQYLTVSVDIGGRRMSRCYSISSPPTRPDSLTITVKRVPGGPVSNWLHDHLGPGDSLEVSGPYGSFTPVQHPAPKQLYLSAGSGITPLMSMARTLVDQGTPADLVFVHHARTPADIIFRSELERIHETHPGIRVVLVCENDAADEPWSGHRGRIEATLLDAVAADVGDREVFICGPPPYRNAARALVLAAGADPGRVHEESYVFGEGSSVVAALPHAAAETYTVEFRRSERFVECSSGTTILQAATEAGLTLPSSCREGVCGTCKTGLLSGAVEMNHGGGIRPREIAQQQILLCCSTPTSDVVVDA